jgi:hypothetical protein
MGLNMKFLIVIEILLAVELDAPAAVERPSSALAASRTPASVVRSVLLAFERT